MLRKYYGSLVGLLVLLACGPTIRFNYDPGIDFKSLKTWAWVEQNEFREGGRGARRNQRLLTERPLMDKRIEVILEKELISMGYQKVSISEAQFLVRQYARYKQVPVETRTRMSSNYWGWGWGWPGPGIGGSISTTRRDTYEQGTIMIEIVDTKTNEPIWEAGAVNALSDVRDPDEADAQITRAIKGALAKLPR